MTTPIEMLRGEAAALEAEAERLDEKNAASLRRIEHRTRLVNEYRAQAQACRDAAEALMPAASSPGFVIREVTGPTGVHPFPAWPGQTFSEVPTTSLTVVPDHTHGVCAKGECPCHTTIEQGGGGAG